MSKLTGLKYDQGKPRMDLLSSIAVIKLANVLTFGAVKYSDNNWRGGIKYSRLLGASLRHIMSYIGGETKDPESGLSHLAHAMCCLMMLLEFEDTKPELDDRYKPSSDTTTMIPIEKVLRNRSIQNTKSKVEKKAKR